MPAVAAGVAVASRIGVFVITGVDWAVGSLVIIGVRSSGKTYLEVQLETINPMVILIIANVRNGRLTNLIFSPIDSAQLPCVNFMAPVFPLIFCQSIHHADVIILKPKIYIWMKNIPVDFTFNCSTGHT